MQNPLDKNLDTTHSNAQEQCQLGTRYYEGKEVPRDDAMAVKYWQLAAIQGYAEAQYNLGTCYYSAVSQHFPGACCNVAGIPRDEAMAVKYFQLAAAQGHPGAQYLLAGCYSAGHGIVIDLAMSIKYYHLSADQGYAAAQWVLGTIYTNGGFGLSKDPAKAVKYYHLAAKQGHEAAQRDLKIYHELGIYYKEDRSELEKNDGLVTQLEVNDQPKTIAQKTTKIRLEDKNSSKIQSNKTEQQLTPTPQKITITSQNNTSPEQYEALINDTLLPLTQAYLAHLQNARSTAIDSNTDEPIFNTKFTIVQQLVDCLVNPKECTARQRVEHYYTILNEQEQQITQHRDPGWKRFIFNVLIAGGILISGIVPGLVALKLWGNSLRIWESHGQTFFDKAKVNQSQGARLESSISSSNSIN